MVHGYISSFFKNIKNKNQDFALSLFVLDTHTNSGEKRKEKKLHVEKFLFEWLREDEKKESKRKRKLL